VVYPVTCVLSCLQLRLSLQVTYKRYKKALKLLGAYPQEGPAASVLDVLFGTSPPRFALEADLLPVNTGLNTSQVDAARPKHARSAHSVA
jgi:hypothetical protein